MSKICNKCGAELEDGVLFCDKCGAKQEDNTSPSEVTPIQPAGDSQSSVSFTDEVKGKFPVTTIIGVAAVAVVAVIVVILICSLVSGGAKSTVKDYMKAFEKGNAKKCLNLTIPKSCQEDYIDEQYNIEVDEYIELQNEVYKAMWDGFKEEGKVKFDYEIKEVERFKKLDKLKDDVKDLLGEKMKDVKDFRDLLEDNKYDEELEDFDVDKVKDVYAVELKYVLEVDGDKICKENSALAIVYKYEGKWYLLNPPIVDYTVYSALTKDGKWDDDKEKYVYDMQDVVEDMDKAYEDLHEEMEED